MHAPGVWAVRDSGESPPSLYTHISLVCPHGETVAVTETAPDRLSGSLLIGESVTILGKKATPGAP